ncbi:MAG TPA: hypothetical protein GX008_03070 [Firmicutes bacterium]|nr:hypothetical protein [Bacillota bacterium]
MRRYNHRINERARLETWERERQAAGEGIYAAALIPGKDGGLGLENARLLVLADLYRRLAVKNTGNPALGYWGDLRLDAREEARQLGLLLTPEAEAVPTLCVEARDYAYLSRSRPRAKTLVCGRLFGTEGLSITFLLPDFGADAIRIALLFQGPPQKDLRFNPELLGGAFRFVQRLWRLGQTAAPGREEGIKELRAEATQRLEGGKPHTALAALMGFASKLHQPTTSTVTGLAGLVAPFAPFVAGTLLDSLAIAPFQDDQGWNNGRADG